MQIAGQSGLVPYTQVRGEKDRDNRADAHVCEGDVAGVTKPQVSNTRTLSLSSPTSSDDTSRIHDEWLKALGVPLQRNQAKELETLASEDYPRAHVAIARTKANNPTNPFAYFKAVYHKLTAGEVATAQPTPKKTNEERLDNMLAALAKQKSLTGQRSD